MNKEDAIMTRFTLALSGLVFTALPAFAHPGHVLTQSGHSHIAGYAALALAAFGAAGLAAQTIMRRVRARKAKA